jgi:hypothetical protein
MEAVPNADSLKRIPGCLRARSHHGNWHMVLEGAPDTVKQSLEQSLGTDGIRCERLNLEELFVELMGDRQ